MAENEQRSGGGGHGGGGKHQQQQAQAQAAAAAAAQAQAQQQQQAQLISRLQKELEEKTQKLNDANSALANATGAQKKSASLLDAELKQTSTLRSMLDIEQGKTKALLQQIDEYKKLVNDSVQNNSGAIDALKRKKKVENAALFVGGVVIPAGLVLAATVSQNAGIATSTAGAATFFTAAAVKLASSPCPAGKCGGSGSPESEGNANANATTGAPNAKGASTSKKSA